MTEALNVPLQMRNRENTLLLCTGFLMLFGLVMMTSASMDFSAENYKSPFYHMKKHLVYMVIAATGGWICSRIPMAIWMRYGWVCLLGGFFLLAVVLIPGIGRNVNGSQRWIAIGPMTLQASELVKICVVIYMAGYLVRRQQEVQQQWRGFIKPIGILAVLIVLLLLEPDFGAVVVLLGTCMGMIFLAGVKMGQFLSLISVSGIAVYVMVSSSEYRMKRWTAYLDPWSDQYGSGYQLTQSLIAFGKGEWFGVGLGNSVQKLFYLPEAHTDFVFAILAEELGFVGVMLVIAMFALLVYTVFCIARTALENNQPFMCYVASGAGLIIAGQAFINIGVTAGLLPTKGLTLPFMSYGGSSLIVCCALIGLTVRITRELQEAPAAKPEAKPRAGKKRGVRNDG